MMFQCPVSGTTDGLYRTMPFKNGSAQEHLGIAHGGIQLLNISESLSNTPSPMLNKTDFPNMVPPNRPKNAHS